MAAWASTALIGRLPELERLEEHLRQATAGRGGTVLVAGDAGIGKTRLVTELGARARAAGAQPLLGRCIDLVGAEVAYLPVAEALRPLTAREDVRELLASARELRWLLPAPVPGEEPARRRGGAPRSRLGLLEELLALLDVTAAAEPVVLVLEDLHWADTSTLDLVALLAHNLAERRVLLLGTYRADEPPAEHRLRRLVTGLLRAGVAARLELGPLGREELEALLQSRTPPQLAPAVTEAIIARSEGNRSSPRSCWRPPARVAWTCRTCSGTCCSSGSRGWNPPPRRCCAWPPPPAGTCPTPCWRRWSTCPRASCARRCAPPSTTACWSRTRRPAPCGSGTRCWRRRST
jgi:hypothetical protein